MKCEICKSSDLYYYKLLFFGNKIPFYKCRNCNFSSIVNFVSSDILKKIYGSEYWQKDYGWETRSRGIVNLMRCLWGNKLTRMSICDYGAGTGYVSQLLRNDGCTVYTFDPYYAPDGNAISNEIIYDLLIAIEVVEHFQDPVAEFDKIFEKKARIIFFTTLLSDNVNCMKNWWYAKPESGHFSFWSKKSLYKLAYNNNLYYFRLSDSYHLFLKSKTYVYLYRYIIKYCTKNYLGQLYHYLRLFVTK